MNLGATLGLVLLLVLPIASCRSAPTPAGSPGDGPGPGDGGGSLPTDPNCPAPAPEAGARCLQECGPPVAREGDPPAAYRWFAADEAKSRESFGCPRCLDASTTIATPRGAVRVDQLRMGDEVWTETLDGLRVAAPILRVARVPVPSSHRLVALRLGDGRELRVSAGHPLAFGGAVGDLAVGSRLDGAVVFAREEVAPERAFTFDVLPAGETGRYWAGGIRLGSTLRHGP